MAKTENEKNKFYTRLIVSSAKKYTFLFFVIFLTFAVTYLIFQLRLANREWHYLILPISAIGLMLCFYPDYEEWEYKPWQSSPQQYERHFRD